MLRYLTICGLLTSAPILSIATSAEARERESTAPRHTGPWNLSELKQPPQAEWGEKTDLVQQVFYAGEPFEGRPTRVFAYYARPAEGSGPFPAMLLVHGGGGKAFAEWATLWAKRGYVALAMDLAGHGPDGKRLSDGGPEQDDKHKFREFQGDDVKNMWTYHAVADVLRGHSLLASRSEVDPERIGVTGISWGGYLTCIIAGVDDRVKAAVPVYGCGFLDHNSTWLPTFEKMPPEQRERWVANFDPSQYLPGVSCPILFVNGTNDFAYPLDSYQKSYELVPGPVELCIRVKMPHGHPAGWAPIEIGLFIDSVLTGGKPLAKISAAAVRENQTTAQVESDVPIKRAELHYATAEGEWKKREWQTLPAEYHNGTITASLPPQRPLVFYLSATDDRDALVNTPHVVLEKP